MNTRPRFARARALARDWAIPLGLVALGLVPSLAGTARLAELATGADVTPDNARFLAAPVPVILHVLAAVPYGLLGAFQFAPALRRRPRSWHRVVGWALVPAALVVALTGLWMASSYALPAFDGPAVHVERWVFGTAMLGATVLGTTAIARRDFRAHGEWMTRAYAIALGAGTQVFTHLPWFLLVGGMPSGTPRAVMMGAGWVINVVVAEWAIRRARRPARAPAPSVSLAAT